MPQKVGKKVGIHFYENVLSEINLLLQKSETDEKVRYLGTSGLKTLYTELCLFWVDEEVGERII